MPGNQSKTNNNKTLNNPICVASLFSARAYWAEHALRINADATAHLTTTCVPSRVNLPDKSSCCNPWSSSQPILRRFCMAPFTLPPQTLPSTLRACRQPLQEYTPNQSTPPKAAFSKRFCKSLGPRYNISSKQAWLHSHSCVAASSDMQPLTQERIGSDTHWILFWDCASLHVAGPLREQIREFKAFHAATYVTSSEAPPPSTNH
eukprot:1321658-Amphidinium_carterae.2